MKLDAKLPQHNRDNVEDLATSKEHLMTIKEVADYLSIHEMTLYTLLHETDLPAMKLGGQWRFKKSLLDEWLVRQMKQGKIRTRTGSD